MKPYKVILIFLMGTYFVSMVAFPVWKGGGSWTYLLAVWREWQSFNAGVLALVAGGFVLFSTHIEQERKNRDRERKKEALRLRLPHHLSEIDIYIKTCIDALNRIDLRNIEGSVNEVTFNEYAMPYFEPLAHFFEFLDDQDHREKLVRERIQNIIYRSQIQNSRIKDLFITNEMYSNKLITENQIFEYYYDILYIKAYVGSLFKYSRNFKDEVDDIDLINAARISNISADLKDRLIGFINRRESL
ncbi:hypothetical protein [Yunchengibacter salinarum]|uniref:hypothetical protein n=1 Tax=Yunchengibacter salinarum TaxID=3133399 RepID=UPI0035B5C625